MDLTHARPFMLAQLLKECFNHIPTFSTLIVNSWCLQQYHAW